MSTPASVKQQAQFLAWGMPLIYVATAGIVVAAFVPTFRANAGYIRANLFGHVGKLTLFSVLNIVISIFLYWSSAIHYSLISFLLSFMVACTVNLPTFPRDFARPLTYIYILWILIQTGVAPVEAAGQGILNVLSLTQCYAFYKSEPTVVDKLCKDSWVTFTVFCAIITIGLNFLTTLLLASIGFDPVNQAEVAASSDAAGNANSQANIGGGYQQPTVGGANNSDYQSYQNYQSADPVAKEQVA
eukprot:GILI01020977.1.p1 GENE.GILI01020977.1~~GILI01020977.1.p1  ORF type:complete len:264 (+),score=55.51 GILI01020977.1:61-792(+)